MALYRIYTGENNCTKYSERHTYTVVLVKLWVMYVDITVTFQWSEDIEINRTLVSSPASS